PALSLPTDLSLRSRAHRSLSCIDLISPLKISRSRYGCRLDVAGLKEVKFRAMMWCSPQETCGAPQVDMVIPIILRRCTAEENDADDGAVGRSRRGPRGRYVPPLLCERISGRSGI